MTTVRIAAIRYPVTTLGPGTRVGIWFQGCHLGCAGCLSRDTWAASAGREMTIAAVIEEVETLAGDGPIDGVTISGGEPFEQPEALMALIDRLRSAFARSAWQPDILCYSGMRVARLREDHGEIVGRLDALIPEPFLAHAATQAAWRGSANQPLVICSELGARRYGGDDDAARTVQIIVHERRVELIGIPRNGDLSAVETTLAEAGITFGETTWRP